MFRATAWIAFASRPIARTDTIAYFVSEASVYRLLKAHDLITSPANVVIKAADEFKGKTTAPTLRIEIASHRERQTLIAMG
jgi:hypothetical protein